MCFCIFLCIKKQLSGPRLWISRRKLVAAIMVERRLFIRMCLKTQCICCKSFVFVIFLVMILTMVKSSIISLQPPGGKSQILGQPLWHSCSQEQPPKTQPAQIFSGEFHQVQEGNESPNHPIRSTERFLPKKKQLI